MVAADEIKINYWILWNWLGAHAQENQTAVRRGKKNTKNISGGLLLSDDT